MNKVVLMGRLVADPEIRYTSGENNMAIGKFRLAVDRKGKKGEADFIPVIAFGKLGEFVEKYLKKGTKVTLSGRIQTGSYDHKDGYKVYTTDIIAEEIEFAESKGAASEKAAESNPTPGNEWVNIPDGIDEELPFN